MTGYASTTRELTGAALSVEIRSVNHRYLDLQFRLPEELRVLETGLRELITAKLQRGKVECRIGLNALPNAAKAAELNNEALKQLRALSEKLRLAWPSVPGLTAADILRWPGMLSVQEVSAEEMRADCYEALQAVLEDFTDSRAREGEKLKAVLLERMASMEERIAVVAPRMPHIIAAQKRPTRASGLTSRIRRRRWDRRHEGRGLLGALSKQKLFHFRDEELARLQAHLSELKRILSKGGAVGKRLDFMMQELNREANTLGSKSVDVEVTRVSLDLKLLIEQMREQIQNIE